jgi:segregation and condensation protein B
LKNTYIQIIESLLFASDTPLTINKLKSIVPHSDTKNIKKCIDSLNENYNKTHSALKIIEVANGYQLVTKEEYSEYVQQLFKGRSASKLSIPGLETLAIIAYEQPITKQRMEHIRGVNVDGVVKTLLERNLISIVGREKAPGNPLLYGTTNFFLEYFGIKNLKDLPKLKEIDELLKGDEEFLKSLDQIALQQLEPEKLGITNVALENQSELELNKSLTDSPVEDEKKSDDDKIE